MTARKRRTETASHPACVLITGATEGIGRELARRHSLRGDRLFLTGRRPLAEAKRDAWVTDANYCAVDFSTPAGVDLFLAWWEQARPARGRCLDRFYANAGTGSYGPVVEATATEVDTVLEVNTWAPIALTHALLPDLRPRARLVYVSSIAATLPAPDYAIYGASKAALEAFARALRAEFDVLDDKRSPKPTITVARPGPTRTELHARVGYTADERTRARWASAADVAREIEVAADRRRPHITPGFGPRFLTLVDTLAPGLVDRLARARPAPGTREPRPPAHLGPCVITGFANGIGRALALEFGAHGDAVIGIDLDQAAGAEVTARVRRQGQSAWNVTGDLTTEEGRALLMDRLRGHGAVSTFIHNAGINAFGPFGRDGLARARRVYELNLRAPLLLTPQLLRKGALTESSRLISIASLSCQVGYPGAAVYAATKAGLASYTRSLRAAGLPTLTVFPGPTRTAHAREHSPDNSREDRRMAPETVAHAIRVAAQQGRTRLVPGPVNRAFAVLGRLAPLSVSRKLAAGLLGEATSRSTSAPRATRASSSTG